jgi:hypothetical protein
MSTFDKNAPIVIHVCVNEVGVLEEWAFQDGHWCFVSAPVFSGMWTERQESVSSSCNIRIFFLDLPHPEECGREILDSWIEELKQ